MLRRRALPRLGWHGTEQGASPSCTRRGAVTPAQRPRLVLLHRRRAVLGADIVGAASAHYHADIGKFFGFDLAASFPFNLVPPGTCSWPSLRRAVVPGRRHLPCTDRLGRSPRPGALGLRACPVRSRRRLRQPRLGEGRQLPRIALHVGSIALCSVALRAGNTSTWAGSWEILLVVGMVPCGSSSFYRGPAK